MALLGALASFTVQIDMQWRIFGFKVQLLTRGLEGLRPKI